MKFLDINKEQPPPRGEKKIKWFCVNKSSLCEDRLLTLNLVLLFMDFVGKVSL